MNIRHIKTYGTLLSIPEHVYVHTGWLRVQHLAHVLLRHTDRRSQDWMEMTCSGLVNITKQSISLNANWLDLSGRLPRAQTLVMEFWAKTDAFPSPSRWCAVTFLNYEFDPRNLWKVSCVAALRSRCKYYCFALKLKNQKIMTALFYLTEYSQLGTFSLSLCLKISPTHLTLVDWNCNIVLWRRPDSSLWSLHFICYSDWRVQTGSEKKNRFSPGIYHRRPPSPTLLVVLFLLIGNHCRVFTVKYGSPWDRLV